METSLLAYEKVRPKLPKRRNQVLTALKELNYATNSMIAEHLGWSINRVTPRVFELRQLNLVTISHISWCPVTKNKAKYWKIK